MLTQLYSPKIKESKSYDTSIFMKIYAYFSPITVLIWIIIGLVCSSHAESVEDSLFSFISYELGKREGLSSHSEISDETLQKVLLGVRNQDKNSIYFYGLLKLYGISVPKDPSIAAAR
jgi:hypothetical protein